MIVHNHNFIYIGKIMAVLPIGEELVRRTADKKEPQHKGVVWTVFMCTKCRTEYFTMKLAKDKELNEKCSYLVYSVDGINDDYYIICGQIDALDSQYQSIVRYEQDMMKVN